MQGGDEEEVKGKKLRALSKIILLSGKIKMGQYLLSSGRAEP